MQLIPANLAARDVQQWLSNSWFVHQGEPYYFVTVDPNGRTILGMRGADGRHVQLATEECAIHWPLCGSINVLGVAIHLIRIPHRVYTRSYNSRVLEMQIPNRWQAENYFPDNPAKTEMLRFLDPAGWTVVREVFNPTYPPMAEARELIRTRQAYSVALNRRVIIVPMHGSVTDFSVLYRGKAFGELINGAFMCYGTDPDIEQRIRKVLGVM